MDNEIEKSEAEPSENVEAEAPAAPEADVAADPFPELMPEAITEAAPAIEPAAEVKSEDRSEKKIIFECRNLCKNYGTLTALNNVSFKVKAGEVVGLLGPNASGKSTLIKLAMGMLQPNSGNILIDGKAPCPDTKKITSYLPDANYLFNWMTVEKQVKYCADFFLDFNMDKCDRLLDRLQISKKQKIKALSKGTKEKLGLILTMSRDAELYILDEPIAGVDPAARDFILDTVMGNRAEGSTIFLCTHLIADIEPILTQAIFLNRGNVALDGSVEEVKKREGKSLDELFREVFRW